ncbi:hypothetical protein IEO21_03773 [Rhodonia placenta]|uniref:HAD-like protein n=2 Tax=Rhodonia placenta TaxID=104341 RepID=A0A1X6MU84_9APHY|nr:hypothetical protein POSPLADRAFT_1149674 [Postia placenta MAD-698-R-SB12]KAF9816899.1 hypothetical protein IEO21_03773 [Postia placenta]OSX59786.1 hypothetical protein POSPLADRAFT_1149674 [Postia placenta MAD-698-R-SB12]
MSYSTLILDLGDVLFTWSSQTQTSIPPRTFKSFLSSPIWADYERGLLSQTECYAHLAAEFSCDTETIATAFDRVRESLTCNDVLVTLVKELKAQSHGRLQVFALSNISAPDYEHVRRSSVDWTIFDNVYFSGSLGLRKPEEDIYRYLIEDTGIAPREAVFVDDKEENVAAARACGMRGIVFDKQGKGMHTLQSLFQPASQMGRDWLRRNAGKMESVTSGNIIFEENYAQLLILELTGDRSLIQLSQFPRTWNFFRESPFYRGEPYPNDLDDTSLALSVLPTDRTVLKDVMDEMLNWRTPEGIMLTYYDVSRPRIDPIVNVNVLTLFYLYGRGRELDSALDWVRDILATRAHLDGSYYYPSPDLFLYLVSRLLSVSADTHLHGQLAALLAMHVAERIGMPGDAMARACRVLVCMRCGVENVADMRALREMQNDDGGWDVGWLYKLGRSDVHIGNRGVATALAVKALEAVGPID